MPITTTRPSLFQKLRLRRQADQQPKEKTNIRAAATSARRQPPSSQALGARSGKSIFSRRRNTVRQDAARQDAARPDIARQKTTPRPPETHIYKTSGAYDSSKLLGYLQEAEPDFLLYALWQTSSHPDPRSDDQYDQNFYNGFQSKLEDMSNGDLLKLYKRVNNSSHLRLRRGLAHAAQSGLSRHNPNQKALQREYASMSDRFEALNAMMKTEIKKREIVKKRKLSAPRLKPLSNWRWNKKTEQRLDQFSQMISHDVRSASSFGRRGMGAAAKIRADLKALCEESQLPEEQTGRKRTGFTRLVSTNRKSKELSVSDTYIVDFNRMSKTFIADKKATTSKQIGLGPEDRQEISDHLLEFCQGRVNQSRRLSNLLSQAGLAQLYKEQANGELVTPPSAGSKHENGIYIGEVVFDLSVTREDNGDMRIHVDQSLRPRHYSTRDMTYSAAIDGRKSFINTEMDVYLPKEDSAPPQVSNLTYDAHIVEDTPIDY